MSKILWPLIHNEIRKNKVSNTFGRFKERTSGTHWGWDFYAVSGTPCFAIADGIISKIYGNQSDTGSFGLVTVLEFNFLNKKLYAAYCHLSSTVCSEGQDVNAGDMIGTTGNSGNASTMKGLDQHLHFEIRISVRPPPGESGRMSPIKVFGICQLNYPIIET